MISIKGEQGVIQIYFRKIRYPCINNFFRGFGSF